MSTLEAARLAQQDVEEQLRVTTRLLELAKKKTDLLEQLDQVRLEEAQVRLLEKKAEVIPPNEEQSESSSYVAMGDGSMGQYLVNLQGQYICPYGECIERKFETKANLIRHMVFHNAKRTFKCSWPECCRTFGRANSLAVHLAAHARYERPVHSPFPCERGCTRTFRTREQITQHHRAEHPIRFTCTVPGCPKSFTRSRSLDLHMRRFHAPPHVESSAESSVLSDSNEVEKKEKKGKDDDEFAAPAAKETVIL